MGGIGWGVVGGVGVPLTHVHTHAHVHVVNMIISCKWLPPLGESLRFPYDVICAHMCMCMCVGAPSHHPPPTSTHPPAPRGDPWNQSKFNST